MGLSYQKMRIRRSFNGGKRRFSLMASSSFKPTQPLWFFASTSPPHGSDFLSPSTASGLPLSKLKPRLLPLDSSSTQARHQEVFAVDSSVKPAGVVCLSVCVSVCNK